MGRKESYDAYTEYYLNQAGSGFSNIYAAPVYQKGYGIGSFLGGLFRTVYPILKKSASAVGSELLKSGSNIISDIVSSQDPRTAIKNRGKETINNLSRLAGDNLFGSGYKSSTNLKRAHSNTERGSVKKQKRVNKKAEKKKTAKRANTKKNTIKRVNNKKKTQRNKNEIFDIFD